ncbi:MAG: hypothetical protein V3R68_05810 [Gammaproteobacteria bacterium]
MISFDELINATEEELIQILYKFNISECLDSDDKPTLIAGKLGLRTAQLVCSVGFNPNIRNLPEVPQILGYENFDALAQIRNEFFISDIYKKLTLANLLSIYNIVKNDPDNQQIMQYLLTSRLETIEGRIEETVNSMIIEKYKEEMRAIYSDGIANIDFAEERLNKTDSGFRALINEVAIIIETKVIPAGEIFFRDTILPEEKRKLLDRGLIPRELVEARLEDDTITDQEKKMLYDHLKMNRV